MLLVPLLSFLSSLALSFSTGAEPHDRPRVSLVCVCRAGPGTVDEGALLLMFWCTPPALWFGSDDGWPDFELWLCVEFSVPVFLSCRRSWFSWLTRSSCVSSSSIRLRCVSKSLAWFSMMLFSSRRYSTARLGLSGLDSIVWGLPCPPPTWWVQWGGDQTTEGVGRDLIQLFIFYPMCYNLNSFDMAERKL